MRFLSNILLICVLCITLTQCSTSLNYILLSNEISDRVLHPELKYSVNYHPWDSTTLNLKGYFENFGAISSDLQIWFLDDGSIAFANKEYKHISSDQWGMYNIEDSLIIIYKYQPIDAKGNEISVTDVDRYKVVIDTFYIETDTTISRLMPPYEYSHQHKWRTKIYYRFVPNDSTPTNTFSMRKHRWMWEDGVMPQDTL